jgi:hypothetical protein
MKSVLIRLGVAALAVTCLWFILICVVDAANSADFDGDWLLEELTCEELREAYGFNLVVLDDLLSTYTNCVAYSQSPADTGHGELHCALLRKHGEFVQGQTNDIVNVYNANPKCTGEE